MKLYRKNRILTIIFYVILGSLAVDLAAQQNKIQQQLELLAKEIRPQLPVTINGITWHDIKVEGVVITYSYQFPKKVENMFLGGVFQLQDSMMEALCQSELRSILNSGVTMVYDYRDSELKEVLRMDVTEKECKSRGF